MKRSSFALLILTAMALSAVLNAQTVPAQIEQEPRETSYRIHADQFPSFRAEAEKADRYFRAHPEALRTTRLGKTSGWGFVVGSAKSWKAYNLDLGQFYSVPSTCRAVGTSCYVFAENSQWGTAITQAVIDSVRIAFDERTPANANKGIYQTDVEAFGNPPDIDNDPKIVILLLDIKDGYTGSGGYVAGYFHSVNELPFDEYPTGSNQAEIYYLDCNPLNLTTKSGIVVGMSTTAHEFQHMIHYNYDHAELSFINEGCSTVAEVNAGYPIYDQSGFNSEPNHYLLDWRSTGDANVLKDYSRSARFMTYLRDQFTMAIFKPLVASTSTGVAGLNSALGAVGAGVTFPTVLTNWFIANSYNNRSSNAAYGYVYPNLPSMTGKVNYSPIVASASGSVQPMAAEYLTFSGGSNLSINFSLAVGSPLVIKAVERGVTTRLLDVTPNVPFAEPEFGTTYASITFIIMNTSGAAEGYTYQSSGTATAIKQQWDTQEPLGLLTRQLNDTVCVTFDAVPNGRLDSIDIALRRAGSATGGIYSYTGLRFPLGTKLATITAASTFETPLTGSLPYPYPVPYPNYCRIDLRSSKISAAVPLAVAFPIGANPNAPGFVVTTTPYTNPAHNYTYTTLASGSNPAGWYVYTANAAGDSMWVYPWRAYFSIVNASGVREAIAYGPKVFSLEQNYPNPFNPSTTFEFSLPQTGLADLKIYNVVGQEVATLFHGSADAGRIYRADFHALNLPSGLYLARLKSGTMTATRKMTLLR